MVNLKTRFMGIEGSCRHFRIIAGREEIETPGMLSKREDSLVLLESFVEEREREGNQKLIRIKEEDICHLPHLMPDFRMKETRERIRELTADIDRDLISLSYYPEASVYRPLEDRDVQLFLIKDVGKNVDFRDLMQFLIDLRQMFPLDTPFALLSPTNEELIPFLVYLGIDIVNIDPFLLQAWEKKRKILQNPYFGWNVGVNEEDLRRSGTEITENFKTANKRYLNRLFKTLRDAISKGVFRNFIEAWSHVSHTTDACLSILDNEEQDFLSKYLSLSKSGTNDFIGDASFHRPIVQYYTRKIKQEYSPPSAKVVLFLPCSARKPYSDSPSHEEYIRAIRSGTGGARYKLHEMIITSPFGVIPRELEATPPAVNYDITVTGHWSRGEVIHTADLVKSYLRKQKRKNADLKILVHLQGGYLKAVTQALKEMGLEYRVTSKNHPRTERSLRSLKEELKKILDRTIEEDDWRKRNLEEVRAVLSYQFNPQIAEKITKERKVVGKPRTKRWRVSGVIQFSPDMGFFIPLKEGGDILSNAGRGIIELKEHPKGEAIRGKQVKKVEGEILPGTIFVGTLASEPTLAAKALVPGFEMERTRKAKVAESLLEF